MARMLSLDPEEIKRPENGRFDSRSSNWRLIGLILFFLFYLAFGASIFSAIESPIEKQEVERLMKKKTDFLKNYPCISESALNDLVSEIVEANNRGVTVGTNGTNVPSWSFGQSFFFASTVVTTIGYGHQTPLSPEGKSFCIIYALIGIPMTLILLTGSVEKLLVPVEMFLIFLNANLGNRMGILSIRILHLFLIIVLVIIFLFLIPAAIFTKIEPHWNFLDSLYYCFISLTTVGLGDFIPGDSPGQNLRPLYKACTTFYLLIGVTVMTLTLSVIYSIPEFDLSSFFLMNCVSGRSGHVPTVNLAGNGSGGSDPERIRLNSAGPSGPMYTQQNDDNLDVPNESQRRIVIRARSRPNEDSPSASETEQPEPNSKGKARLH